MLHHIVFDVPDDEVIDNRLEATGTYMSLKDGALTPKQVSGYVENFHAEILNHLNLAEMHVKETSVLICKYPEECSPEEARLLRDVLKAEFPEHKVICMTSSIELMEQNPDEAIDMLNRMIAHIKIVN